MRQAGAGGGRLPGSTQGQVNQQSTWGQQGFIWRQLGVDLGSTWAQNIMVGGVLLKKRGLANVMKDSVEQVLADPIRRCSVTLGI